MKSLSAFVFILGIALLPQNASAEQDRRDHRKPVTKKTPTRASPPRRPPSPRDAKSDRRDAKPDRRDPKSKDYRGPKTVGPNAVDVRDHRTVQPAKHRNEIVPATPGRARSWRNYEMPVVNRFWPAKGAVGTSVTIYGANFESGLTVSMGGTAMIGVTTTPTSVTFKVPRGATNGLISIRSKKRTFAVGSFEVAAEYDAESERKKLRDEQRKQAEASWKQRRKNLSSNREERVTKLRERELALEASREKRRTTTHAEIRARFEADFLADADTRVELSLHSERLARLQRMERLAEVNDDSKLAVRIQLALTQENSRHTARITTLKTSFQSR